jgi:hypothetical protein
MLIIGLVMSSVECADDGEEGGELSSSTPREGGRKGR